MIIFNICICTATLGNIAITRCSVITYVNDEPTAAAAAGGRGERASVQMIDIPRPMARFRPQYDVAEHRVAPRPRQPSRGHQAPPSHVFYITKNKYFFSHMLTEVLL